MISPRPNFTAALIVILLLRVSSLNRSVYGEAVLLEVSESGQKVVD